MSFTLQFAINILLDVLQLVIKNPALKAEVQTVLLDIANQIYAVYGQAPPTQVTSAVNVKKIG
jgi:hypothetical protein